MTLLATQYMMSGRFITAEAALRHGLVAEVVPPIPGCARMAYFDWEAVDKQQS